MYISSQVNKYGDSDRVSSDAKLLNDILSRQGTSLLIDVIAEFVGNTANKFSYDSKEIDRLTKSLVSELKSAINERT